MNQEIRSLTGLRGLSALLVMFYHFNSFRLLEGPARTFVAHGYLMVDVFFILSGYVMAMVYGELFTDGFDLASFYTFLSRRLARIYPLYVIMTVPAALLIATGWMDHWEGPAIAVSALVNLTMFQQVLGIPTLNTPGWSISAEWLLYLIFPLLAALCLHGRTRRAVLIALTSMVALPLITMAPSLVDEPKRAGILDIWHYGTLYPVVRALIGFVMGLLAYRVSRISRIAQVLGRNWSALPLAFGLVVTLCIKDADLVFAFLLPPFMIAIAQQRSIVAWALGSRPIHWLGELSYAIYMIHDVMIYFIVAIGHWLTSRSLSEHTAMTLSTLGFSALVVGLSYLAFTYIETPARRFLRRLLDQIGNACGLRPADASG